MLGIADASSSRKIKTGEVLKTEKYSGLQTVQGNCSFISEAGKSEIELY